MELSLETECIICCSNITELANPDSCNHDFCKSCLFKWTQRSTKCPICKKTYQNIFIYEKGIKKKLSIEKINELNLNNEIICSSEEEENNYVESIEDDSDDICYVCQQSTDQKNLLICDKCRNNYCHYYCEHLQKIPEKKWICKFCLRKIKENRDRKKQVSNFFL